MWNEARSRRATFRPEPEQSRVRHAASRTARRERSRPTSQSQQPRDDVALDLGCTRVEGAANRVTQIPLHLVRGRVGNSRTEFNVCYDVTGVARLRMAGHPYSDTCQMWSPWLALDGDTTYHLNEVAGGSDEECRSTPVQNCPRISPQQTRGPYLERLRLSICVFDPAPTGIEHHRPGEYSDYEPLSRVAGTELYQRHRRDISKFDEMVERLSRAKAEGTLPALRGTALWELYERGREARASIESNLHRSLEAEGRTRQNIIRPWMQRYRGSMHPTPPAGHTVTGPLHDARSPRRIAS